MSKKHVALVIAGAVVVAGAAYLCFRSRPKKQVPKSITTSLQVPVQESVEELKLKADNGDTSAMCRLGRLLLKEDEVSGLKRDVPLALELLRKASENGDVEAMMCECIYTLLAFILNNFLSTVHGRIFQLDCPSSSSIITLPLQTPWLLLPQRRCCRLSLSGHPSGP
jgi:hypothetical protein